MSSADLPDLERRRLLALLGGDIEAAAPLHADDYQLVTPNGSDMSKDDYLGAIGSGELRYRVFEAVSDIAVLGEGPVAVVRYRARISFDDRPGLLCWHTDCYQQRQERWQVVWSRATRIIDPDN
ncbi:MAG: nuclear transport factor 2 family protein [Streptosporangiaceae bacterium]